MKMKELTFSALFLALISIVLGEEKDLSRGFNSDINWVTFDAGLEIAKAENKPIFFLIHKSWCGACKALKPQFSNNKNIEELSTNFVMINVEDDEEPKDQSYAPDGGYIPRLLFMKPDGTIMDNYNKQGNKSYKYFYHNAEQVIASMKEVLSGKSENQGFDEL